MRRSLLGAIGGCVAAVALVGCQKAPPAIVSVSGVVLLNGQPLPNALIKFVPMLDHVGVEYVAVGLSDGQGRFTVTCPGKDGAAVGETRVTVIDAPAPENARGRSGEAQAALARYVNELKNRPIPDAYQNVAQTPLVVTVTAGQSEYTLELKR